MKTKLLLLTVSTMLLMTHCSKKEDADIIAYNGVVYTVDGNFSQAEAFAVKDGKFIAVGSSKEILDKYRGKDTIDLQGKPVYPGFMDGHCHFNSLGEKMVRYADLVGCQSFDEVLARLRKHAQENPSDWILGRGWDQNLWGNRNFPTNEKIEELFPDKYVALTRIDGHAGLVSNKVLQLLGFDGKTRIEGGSIMLGSDGKPNGILLDNAYDMVKAAIPKLNHQERTHALLTAQNACFEAGLSGVCDAGLDADAIDLIDSLQSAGTLKMKINAFINDDEETLNHFLPKGIIVKERLSVRTVKLYADGALGSRGARLLAPYSDDPQNTGLLIKTPEYYDSVCQKAYEAGFQVATHAIGDAGVRTILNAYAKVLKGKNDLRWRVEHAQVVDSNDFDLFGKYSIIPSIQSTHATSDMGWAGERLGAERLKNSYAQQFLLSQNDWVINGTDFPIESISPIYTFYAAVARKNLEGEPLEGFQMENALTREQALCSITIWVAKGYFEEKHKGSIEVGKEADFVVLSDDIMTMPEYDIPKTTVLQLFVSGEKVK